MSGSESRLRGNLVKALQQLDAVAVENPCSPGTPDINCTLGWIEVKKTKAWPKRSSTPVRLDHPLLPSQRVWIRRRLMRGGHVWVFVQIGRDYLLFSGGYAILGFGEATRHDLLRNSLAHWVGWKTVTERLVLRAA